LDKVIKEYYFGKYGYASVQVIDRDGKKVYRVVNNVTTKTEEFDNWKDAASKARMIADRYEAIQRSMGW